MTNNEKQSSNTYLLFVYTCNKYAPICINASNSPKVQLDYLDKLLSNDKKYVSDGTQIYVPSDDVEFDRINDIKMIEICEEYLLGDKYFVFNVPFKYYEFIINEQFCSESKDRCNHDDLTLILIKTNKDGSFREQYNDMADIYLI